MKYQAVVFDFFGVICSEVAPFWLARHFGATDAAEIKADLVFSADVGLLSQRALFDELAARTGVPASDIERDWYSLARIDCRAVELIRALQTQTRLGLLTNSPAPFIRRLLHDNKLEGLFEADVVSSEVGCAKPDPRIYRIILDKLATHPGDAVMIDDNPRNIAAATEIGMEGILFQSVDQVRTSLGL